MTRLVIQTLKRKGKGRRRLKMNDEQIFIIGIAVIIILWFILVIAIIEFIKKDITKPEEK